MQEKKEEFKNDTDPKKNQTEILEMKNSVKQTKNSVESLFSRVDQIEVRISGCKDKTDVLKQSNEENGEGEIGHRRKRRDVR
jgi:hypothetical protein